MRISMEICYGRTTNRWKTNKDYLKDEYLQYIDKKADMFNW